MSADYIELHLHSNFSLLEGASHPEELITRAAEYEYPVLALTDHDTLGGALIFAQQCRQAGIRPVTGVELTVGIGNDRCHLTLLAKTRRGYSNLCRLVSIGHGLLLADQGARDRRRRDPLVPWASVAQHTAGVLCLTGCRQGPLTLPLAANDIGRAENRLHDLVEWFGPENVAVELMQNYVHGDRDLCRRLSETAHRVGVRTVATGDIHYHDRTRHRLADALVAIRSNCSLDASHDQRRANHHFALLPRDTPLRRFSEWPEAVHATSELADACRFDLTSDLGYRLPSPAFPNGSTPLSELSTICRRAIGDRYSSYEYPAAYERLDTELRLVERHDLAGFFLIYHEVFTLAREVASRLRGSAPRARANLPPGRGRGSSVGSIICYLIGLSHIDPVRNNLYIGRFLNEDMVALPDIDLDFPRDIRAQLFEAIFQKWGNQHAAIVATYPTYRIRSAIRDLGKALGISKAEIHRLAKLTGHYGSAAHIREEMITNPRFTSLVDAPGWRDLIELGVELAGTPRHLSQHVGGIVISSAPLVDCVPIVPAAWPGRYLCEWDKDSVDDARMVKIDILGLGMLSLVEECVDEIASTGADVPDLSRIDFNDQRVYDRICQGDTIGVFQIESRAQAGMLPRSQPRSLDDLAAQVAIIRPGPIIGGAVHPYLERRERKRADPRYEPEMPHPSLKDALGETLGVVLFQEQVLHCSVALAGWTNGEAEEFRRAMGRKTWPERRDRFCRRFIEGATARGVDQTTAERVFHQLEGFAEFGFPKSHSTAFALLAYQSAWLREYHSAAFYSALLNQYPMGFYPPHVVVNDAQRHGVRILRPSIATSDTISHVVRSDSKLAVQSGLLIVDGIGPEVARRIVDERNLNGQYVSLFDSVHRAAIPDAAMEGLIRIGACAVFGGNRRQLLWTLGLLGGGARNSGRRGRQMMLDLPTEQDMVPWHDFNSWDQMVADYGVMDRSPDWHPVPFLRRQMTRRLLTTLDVAAVPTGARKRTVVNTMGLVVCRQQPMTAKGVVFILLEDEHGLVQVVLSKALADAERLTLGQNAFLRVAGKVTSVSGTVATVRATSIEGVQPASPMTVPVLRWG